VELRHLRYFVAVAEALSFRKAARRLSVSAAALSLESLLSMVAAGRGVLLSPEILSRHRGRVL
jgi:DNA-binding transcriptional LysR family regulator